jgi:hypothetical protein
VTVCDVAGPSSAVPQPWQKRASGALAVPQFEHARDSGDPHDEQNRAAAALRVAQFGQLSGRSSVVIDADYPAQ